MKHIVIIGASFAGLSCVLGLRKRKDITLTLINDTEQFTFIPSLHYVLKYPWYTKHITLSLKKYYGPWFVKGRVTYIGKQYVAINNKKIPYDYCIIAAGAKPSHTQPGVYSYHTLDNVTTIRDNLNKSKSISVIGGGYTGVELASMLATFPHKTIRIIHSHHALIHTMKPRISATIYKALRQKKVEIHLNTKATISGTTIQLTDGTTLHSDMTIMTAGITPATIPMDPEIPYDNTLQFSKTAQVFAVGDAAQTTALKTAHNAMIQARQLTSHINRILDNKPTQPQKSKDWRFIAIALGVTDGVIPLGSYALRGPFVGIGKWLVERRCMLEFKYGIPFPI